MRGTSDECYIASVIGALREDNTFVAMPRLPSLFLFIVYGRIGQE